MCSFSLFKINFALLCDYSGLSNDSRVFENMGVASKCHTLYDVAHRAWLLGHILCRYDETPVVKAMKFY